MPSSDSTSAWNSWPPDAASATASQGARVSARPPNVLVVVLDCARAKSFGSGPGVARTPVIDRLARTGTTFPQAVAPANWTIPSHMSLFTGVYPNRHGLRTFRLGDAPKETIATWLERSGYETAMFTEMVHLVGGYGLESGYGHRSSRHFGLADGERTIANRLSAHSNLLYGARLRTLIERLPPFIVPLNLVNHPQEVAFKREVCGEYVIHEFENWLGRRDGETPFHAFFNLVDPHEPYPIIPNGHKVGALSKWYGRTPRYYLLAVRGLQSLVPWEELYTGYLRCIEEADRKIGRVLDALDRSGELGRTLVIVTGDHGQSFGEGGNVFHGCGATDSITRVPLVVSTPEEFSVPRRVDRWVSLCDVPSWIKAAASGRAPFDEEGRAPFPFSASAPPTEVVYCEGAPASDPNRSLKGVRTDASWNHRLLAAYRGQEKFVLDLESGEVLRWEMRGDDPDRRPPQRVTASEAALLRTEVFGPYEATELARLAPTPGPTAGEMMLDARLRSWGYD